MNVYIRNAYDPVKTAKKNEKKKEENVKLPGMQRIRRTRKIRRRQKDKKGQKKNREKNEDRGS